MVHILKKKLKGIFDGIFKIVKSRTLELEVFEIWYDVIEYRVIELIWKSSFNAEKKKTGVEGLYSKDNHFEQEALH